MERCTLTGTASANPGFAYDGYNRFWRVADLLMRDVEPLADDWLRLLDAPGYRELTLREFARDTLPELFRLAFKPSLGASLARALQGGPLAGQLAHLLHAEQTRADLARRLELVSRLPLAAAAMEAALAWLPRNTRAVFPTVAFVIFGPDARAYQSVVLDVAFFCRLDAPHLLLGHEYHHILRGPMAPSDAQCGDEATACRVLAQLEREGIADQIDKRDWPDTAQPASWPRADYLRRYRRHYEAAPDALRHLDRLLAAWPAAGGERGPLARHLQGWLQLAGHPVGSYMARTIERVLGRDLLVGTVGEPFAFLRLYSEAAASGTWAPPLGAQALQAVAMLEHRWLQPLETTTLGRAADSAT